jgi:hypothetical protein
MYARFARRLPGFLARRDTAEAGRALLAERLANREESFLGVVERAVYGNPGSPYLPLLAEARCELGDLRRMVRQDGLEASLRLLHRAGVHVRFEQFKGRQPMVAGGRDYPEEAFRNPSLEQHLETRSSGSTGRSTRNPISLEHKAARSAITLAVQEAHGFSALPRAKIGGSLPESTGFGGALAGARGRHVAERWFVPQLSPPRKTELRFRLAHQFVVGMARFYGVRVPRQEPMPLDQVIRVARWAESKLAERGGCVVGCTASMALRVAIAARDAGIDLTGTVFRVNGEPLSAAKAAGIAASGARAYASYSMSEVGNVGAACLAPISANEQHLMKDHLALIQAPRAVGDREVDAFLLTTLLPTAPRVMINVEIDDYGIVEERRCGCPLEALGLTTHLRDVRSFGKLTVEGVTLVGSEMEQVLEERLPARFGGSALDYQLVEEEDERGFSRIVIVVDPSVRLESERELLDEVLRGLERASISADLAVRLWNEAGALGVRRARPAVGARGKVALLRDERPRAGRAAS